MVGTLVGAVLLAAGAAYLVMGSAWTNRTVTIFAHRGAAAEAPENTLAAFRLAGEQHTDYVELDVQESQDGVVVVVHDADLMKVGKSPLKVWDTPAEQLRLVDIGSYFGPQFSGERVPTLAEALEACKGVSRVDIELKYYGHNQRLEERVVEIVEAAGMEDSIVTMSLNRDLVAKMKRLRPTWTSGLLTAKAMGDLTHVPADFLAVEKSMATRWFIRAAHRAGKPVYVWTVDDPARMARMIGLGVDGLITNRPGVAREVLDQFAHMTQAQRLFLFVMTTLGAEDEIAPPESELRP
jgi:glycerophosphoryl diester phosphodiesterase